ncbi:unnamed protein product [Trichobilharzia szidati]|nr:unnamed protein product [Trichobilharzia szidati]
MTSHRVGLINEYCKYDPNECTDEEKAKWLCLPGYHPSTYFKCAEWAPQIGELDKPSDRLHFKQDLSRVKKPLEPFRLWKHDESGLRRMDWHPSESDCNPPKLNNFKYTPVCFDEASRLTKYRNIIENLTPLHRRRLLEEFVYRDPDEYLQKRDKKTVECCYCGRLCCDPRPYEDPLPMTQREIMRLRFMSNNYKTFDDWKDDANDELLNSFGNKQTEINDN